MDIPCENKGIFDDEKLQDFRLTHVTFQIDKTPFYYVKVIRK